MKRIYVTTIPLQGRLDLTKNTYRSSANSGDIETRFPILQVLHNTLQEGDDFHIIAIRSVNGDTQRNFGYLKEELQAMGFTEDHIRELPMPDEQDCSTLIRLCRDLCDVLPEKGIAYMDITYGTNNEMGFDYLRDNMALYANEQVQRGHAFAIVDEVDSILIDEARTPLIISGMGEKSTQLYDMAEMFAARLKKFVVVESDDKEEEATDIDADYVVDEKARSVTLTARGVKKAEEFFHLDNLSDPENSTIAHHINQAIKAHGIMKRDVDYVVKDGEVVSTQSARQYKDATDLVMDVAGLDCRNASENGDLCGTLQKGTSGSSLNSIHPVRNGLLIRRLTPLECERLQGFLDGWTNIPNASDSARYKALGNSVAIPCVEFIMGQIAAVPRAA